MYKTINYLSDTYPDTVHPVRVCYPANTEHLQI